MSAMSDIMSDTIIPPNKRMQSREDELTQITASTVHTAYSGGGSFVLTARDDKFWSDTFRGLRDHDYQIRKCLNGALHVEKQPDERHERRETTTETNHQP